MVREVRNPSVTRDFSWHLAFLLIGSHAGREGKSYTAGKLKNLEDPRRRAALRLSGFRCAELALLHRAVCRGPRFIYELRLTLDQEEARCDARPISMHTIQGEGGV